MSDQLWSNTCAFLQSMNLDKWIRLKTNRKFNELVCRYGVHPRYHRFLWLAVRRDVVAEMDAHKQTNSQPPARLASAGEALGDDRKPMRLIAATVEGDRAGNPLADLTPSGRKLAALLTTVPRIGKWFADEIPCAEKTAYDLFRLSLIPLGLAIRTRAGYVRGPEWQNVD